MIASTPLASWLRYAFTASAVALVYLVAGKLSLQLAFLHPSASPVWPPSGIALALLLLFGMRFSPAIAVGAFLVNVTTDGSVVSSLGIAVGNTLEALLGVVLMRRFADGAAAFERVQGVLLFTLIVMASTAVAASVGVLSLFLGGSLPPVSVGEVWFTWWMGDMVGAFIVTPLIVLWSREPSLPRHTARVAEGIMLLVSTVAVGLLIFTLVIRAGSFNTSLAYLSFLPVLWAVVRFGSRETAMVIFFLSSIAIAGTLRGAGPFIGASPNTSLLLLQSFMGVLSVTGMILAGIAVERGRARDTLERSVQERTAQLERALQAKSEFMSLASHQLRTPLTAVRWSLSRLEKALAKADFEEGQQMLSEGRRSAARMAETIDTMLKIARLQGETLPLDMTECNLGELFVQKRQLLHNQYEEKSQSFLIDCPSDLSVVTDVTILREILRNLLQNAVKYTPENGKIFLSARREGNVVFIVIEDTGYGIPAHQQKLVFQKFFRGDNVASGTAGTGLGLYLVSFLTKALNGTIEMQSEEGVGTVFVLQLPAPGEFA